VSDLHPNTRLIADADVRAASPTIGARRHRLVWIFLIFGLILFGFIGWVGWQFETSLTEAMKPRHMNVVSAGTQG